MVRIEDKADGTANKGGAAKKRAGKPRDADAVEMHACGMAKAAGGADEKRKGNVGHASTTERKPRADFGPKVTGRRRQPVRPVEWVPKFPDAVEEDKLVRKQLQEKCSGSHGGTPASVGVSEYRSTARLVQGARAPSASALLTKLTSKAHANTKPVTRLRGCVACAMRSRFALICARLRCAGRRVA